MISVVSGLYITWRTLLFLFLSWFFLLLIFFFLCLRRERERESANESIVHVIVWVLRLSFICFIYTVQIISMICSIYTAVHRKQLLYRHRLSLVWVWVCCRVAFVCIRNDIFSVVSFFYYSLRLQSRIIIICKIDSLLSRMKNSRKSLIAIARIFFPMRKIKRKYSAKLFNGNRAHYTFNCDWHIAG